MEHFILFAIALTVIAFISVLCAKPTPLSVLETEMKSTSTLQENPLESTPNLDQKQEPEFQFFPNQLTSINKLVHEKNWI